MLIEPAQMTLVTCMDLGPAFPEYVLCNKRLEGKDYSAAGINRGLHLPTADELFSCLLDAMAAANNELACMTGPPRRPAEVLVSHRLQHAFPELRQKLSLIGVTATLETAESLERACAQQGTSVATGCEPSQREEAGREAAFCGTLVQLDWMDDEQLNGQVGTVVRWDSKCGKWEVALACHSGQELRRCAHCGADGALQRCSACRSVFYCDRNHQKAGNAHPHIPFHVASVSSRGWSHECMACCRLEAT